MSQLRNTTPISNQPILFQIPEDLLFPIVGGDTPVCLEHAEAGFEMTCRTTFRQVINVAK